MVHDISPQINSLEVTLSQQWIWISLLTHLLIFNFQSTREGLEREWGGEGEGEGEVGSENPNSCSLLFCPLLSILTRILPWQVPCPPLQINRGPGRTLGEKGPHGPWLVWKKLFMISLPSISLKHVQKGTLPMVILQLKSLSGCPTSLFVAYFSDSF